MTKRVPHPTGRYCLFLTATELPALILWAYAIYWTEVCAKVASRAPAQVWHSAVVAGILVGVGLNANAHRALRRPAPSTCTVVGGAIRKPETAPITPVLPSQSPWSNRDVRDPIRIGHVRFVNVR
eukprot:Protomagalhaensia_wolfi_Nauph_80__4794@NODE_4_length_7346_cov_85_118106_g2_i0_p8_GENE_NODE_4_length_7346_cov_85_118106_g2_i0NODE_4_length_7346_cov_85_118106_g2_i0_p8_ORF_typecomplete_len125_score7_34_NODE_4_length_7346_cov_85_118106_g2_i040664440